MRTSDLLPIPNFGDPAGCVAITSDRSQAKASVGNGATEPDLSRPADSMHVSTAVRAFGPGDILAKFEIDLASIVADINAHDRFMRRLPAFLDDPSPLYLRALDGRAATRRAQLPSPVYRGRSGIRAWWGSLLGNTRAAREGVPA